MPLTLLGNNPVNIEDGWVLYNPISLQAGRTYLMEVEIFTSNPDQILSNFQARLAYPSRDTAIVADIKSYKFFYEPIRQAFEFTISPNLAATGNALFAVRRFAFYSRPPTLATCTVALAMDPNVFY